MATYQRSKRSSFILYIVFFIVLLVILISSLHNATHGSGKQPQGNPWHPAQREQASRIQDSILTGHAIAPKLGNETAKAELGRAAWKLFHTTFARFPDQPTQDEKTALKSYIHLFQRLYPCGECASHFGVVLDKFPPQVSSRSAAAAWGCHVHNEVNKSLKKELFDCSQIGDFYDCGCADGDDEDEGSSKTDRSRGNIKGADALDSYNDYAPLELEREE